LRRSAIANTSAHSASKLEIATMAALNRSATKTMPKGGIQFPNDLVTMSSAITALTRASAAPSVSTMVASATRRCTFGRA
jgi:hypothetical protein